MPTTRKAPKLLNVENDITVSMPNWVWFPYIPANCATLLFGVGGIGKSYMSCEIAAALSCGRALPNQKTEDTRAHRILLMSAEDSPSAVIKPRLIKCGANLANIFIPSESFVFDKWGLKVVQDYMEKCKASIIIIDPIVHYMGGKIDMNKMNEVRAITGALHQKAMSTDSAIIILHHARKGSEGQGYEKAAGSADFVNAVRSVLYAHKTNDGASVIEHVKTNYGVMGSALAFKIDEAGFHWDGEYSAEKLATGTTKRDRAKTFLQVVLKDGPVSALEIAKMAKDEGFNMTTIGRAKPTVAESILRYVDETRHWYWRALGDTTEPKGVSKSPEQDTAKLEAERHLREHGLWPT